MMARWLAAALAVVAWVGLAIQFWLIVTVDSPIPVAGRVINFVSYFTILSNILVAAVVTARALDAQGGVAAWLRRPAVEAAAALYIGVTGLVYTLILSGIWEPAGWQLIADAMLHHAVPVLYLAYWAVFARPGTLTFRMIPAWLVFPVAYAAYSLARGPIVDWYPYPFLDLRENTLPMLGLNVVLMMVGFTLFAAMLVAFDRIVGRAADPA
jgi:hypothetical protein